PCSNNAVIANRHTRRDRHRPPKPYIIPDRHRLRQLPPVQPTRDILRMIWCVDPAARTDKAVRSDRNEPSSDDQEVRVDECPVANREPHPIVEADRWTETDPFSRAWDKGFEQPLRFLRIFVIDAINF